MGLAPSPGLLSHWNGAGCESASMKGHLQPLASDVPATGPHVQRPQSSEGPVMILTMTLTSWGSDKTRDWWFLSLEVQTGGNKKSRRLS